MTTQRPLIGLVLVTALVLSIAALRLLGGEPPVAVIAAERALPPRAVPADDAPPVAELVLPGAAVAPAPRPEPASPAHDTAVAPERTPPPAPTEPADVAQAPSGGVLSGTVVDGANGTPCAAEIWLSIPGAPSTSLVLEAPGGAFEQRLETPGRYALVARCSGKVGVLRDVPVVAGGRTQDLVVTLREAARVRVAGVGQTEGAETSVPWTCTLYQEETLIGVVVGPAEAELDVPPGTLTAHLLVPGTGERKQRTVSAAAGELVEIRFD